MDFFKLKSTYELMVELNGVVRPVRIEIFELISKDNFFRVRAWVQSVYNLYPAFLNTDNQGNDLHSIHSSDSLNLEITDLIADDPRLITGDLYDDEYELLKHIKGRISDYQKIINGS